MFRGRGIATAVLAVIVLVIVLVGGVAAYEVLKPSSSSSSTSTATSSVASAETCTLSSSSATSTSFNVIPLLDAFSSMKLNYNVTAGTTTENLTEAYTRIYASPTVTKVNITATVVGGENETQTAWILANGTALAINVAGVNFTSATARETLVGVFAGFSAEVDAADQLATYTAAPYFQPSGTQSVTISKNTFTVTNWSASSLPETITSCPPGTTTDITAYHLSVGTPKGTSTKLVTFFELSGTETTAGATTSVDYAVSLVSFTVG